MSVGTEGRTIWGFLRVRDRRAEVPESQAFTCVSESFWFFSLLLDVAAAASHVQSYVQRSPNRKIILLSPLSQSINHMSARLFPLHIGTDTANTLPREAPRTRISRRLFRASELTHIPTIDASYVHVLTILAGPKLSHGPTFAGHLLHPIATLS